MRMSENTLINIGGAVLPVAITLITIPLYLHLIGDERFGTLAIVWLLLGYFGIFNLGLGRATAKHIAELSSAPISERQSLFWTVLAMNLAFGSLGGIVLWSAGRLLFPLFRISESMRSEVFAALPWLAAAVPVATVVSVLVGALEGREQFLSVNALQVAAEWVFRLVPLGVAYLHGPNLTWLVASSVISRAVISIPMFLACYKYVPLSRQISVERHWVAKLLGFGCWMTISGLVNPLLASIDRFIIGAVSGAAAVTYYTVPFNLAAKFLIVPISICRTLFPRFAMQDDDSARRLAGSAVLAAACISTPIIVFAVFVVRPFFNWWLGARIGNLSATVGEIMLLGAWLNGLLYVPTAFLQARNRPDLVAKFHLCEFIPFVGVLWIGLRLAGAEGAACACTIRLLVHLLLVGSASRLGWRLASSLVAPAVLILVSASLLWYFEPSSILRLSLVLLTLPFSIGWAYFAAPPSVWTMISRYLRVRIVPGSRVEAVLPR